MTDTIASSGLDGAEQATLDALLDALIPEDAERGLPSARGMPVYARFDAAQTAELKLELRVAESEAQKRTIDTFAAAKREQRIAIVSEVLSTRPFFRRLMHAVMTVYYMDDRVMKHHGLAPRAPFPEGHDVETGDFDLLAPVVTRPPFFRPA